MEWSASDRRYHAYKIPIHGTGMGCYTAWKNNAHSLARSWLVLCQFRPSTQQEAIVNKWKTLILRSGSMGLPTVQTVNTSGPRLFLMDGLCAWNAPSVTHL